MQVTIIIILVKEKGLSTMESVTPMERTKKSKIGWVHCLILLIFQEVITPILRKLSKTIETEAILPNSFHVANTTLTPITIDFFSRR